MKDSIDISAITNNKILNENSDLIFSVLFLKDGRMASCSDDKTMKIYNIINDYDCDITIRKHRGLIYSLLVLKDGRLASCSSDRSIKIYDINNMNYHCDITIRGHSDSVSYICQLENEQLFSCSFDRTIKLWTLFQVSFRLDYTIESAHDDAINKIITLSNNRIASCSRDKTIKIWNSQPPFSLIKVLKGHIDSISSIISLKDREKLISCGGTMLDNTLRIWNTSSYQCETVIYGVICCDSNSMLEINKKTVVIGGYHVIAQLNTVKSQITQTIENNPKLTDVHSIMILRDGNVLCGCDKGMMCIYNITTNAFVTKENNPHKDDIHALLPVNEHQFISCSNDETIKVWEY